ncbi:molybdopterin molybdotransferase MoeA [Bermanella sp. R86510]|uniref:molybdopterin molybdotransferase MoeA n=1 Tax=unclassified Bermanella TaxID=2627862 RepID=UPI0037C6843A
MDCCSAPGLTPLDQALEHLLGAIECQFQSECVQLNQACGRILADNITSTLNIPPSDNSAMDGYAMRAHDVALGKPLTMITKIFAGHPYDGELQSGECARIMTGGEIPMGADAVIMQENAHETDDGVCFTQTTQAGANIRPQGEDIKVGDIVLAQGRRLTAADVGLLASLGLDSVPVAKPIVVALISTGDELQSPGKPLLQGQFYESNGYSVEALLRKWGAHVINYGIVPDNLEQLRDTFSEADQCAHVVITSGGVSVGEADYSKTVLEEMGHVDFWKLAIKPGKPFAFGRLPNSYFMGLPGNPVSAMVTLHQLCIPMLAKLIGEARTQSVRLQAKASQALNKRPGRTDFQRGVYHCDEHGQLWVKPTGGQGSGLLTSVSKANCYIILEQDRGKVEQGETVTLEPFDALLN